MRFPTLATSVKLFDQVIQLCRKISTNEMYCNESWLLNSIWFICNPCIYLAFIYLQSFQNNHTHNVHTKAITVDVERFAGLNVCCFNPIEVFMEILSHCLGQKCLLSSIRGIYIHGRVFMVLLKTMKMQKFNPVNFSTFTIWCMVQF